MTQQVVSAAPHLTFDEQADRDPRGSSASPCWCWHAGYGDVIGVARDQVQHPAEWDDGARSAFEKAYDL